MAAPLFAPQARRPSPLALHLTSLPPFPMASPINEKDTLPCIMITPSTPVHEADFEIHFFPPPEKPCRGFLASICNIFSSEPSTRRIALLDTEAYEYEYEYGSTSSSQSICWSAAKRLRVLLLLLGVVFVALHLFVLPHGGQGVFDIFEPAHHNSEPALIWEGWKSVPGTTINLDDFAPTSTVEEAQASAATTASSPQSTEL